MSIFTHVMFGLTAWLRHGHNISLRKGCNQRKDKKAMKDPKSALEAFRELALEALDKEGDKANEEMERRHVPTYGRRLGLPLLPNMAGAHRLGLQRRRGQLRVEQPVELRRERRLPYKEGVGTLPIRGRWVP